jgi:hypothetical protein
VGNLKFFEHFEESGKHRKIPAARTPGGVIGGEVFFGEQLGRFGSRGHGKERVK